MDFLRRLKTRCLGSFAFLLIAYCLLWEPDYIKAQTSLADNLFDLGALLLLALLVVFYLLDLKALFSAFDLCLMLFGGVLVLSTLLHHGVSPELWKCIKYIWPIAGIVILTEQGLRENASGTVWGFYLMCFANVAINTISMVLFPNGIYGGHETEPEPQYWLGNENVFIITILAGLGVGYVTVCLRGKKITWDYLLYLVLCAACARWSVTSMIGLAVFVLFWLLHFLVKPDWFYHPLLYEGLGLAGFFGIVVFHVQNHFAFFIENVLHKDVTLTFRTKLWKRVIKQFYASPWLGYGVRGQIEFSDSVGGKRHWVHAHNYLLDLVNKGGIAALIPFAAALLIMAKKMHPHLSKTCVRVLSITLLAYFVIFIGDCFEMRTPFYGILTLCACAGYLPSSPKESTN